MCALSVTSGYAPVSLVPSIISPKSEIPVNPLDDMNDVIPNGLDSLVRLRLLFKQMNKWELMQIPHTKFLLETMEGGMVVFIKFVRDDGDNKCFQGSLELLQNIESGAWFGYLTLFKQGEPDEPNFDLTNPTHRSWLKGLLEYNIAPTFPGDEVQSKHIYTLWKPPKPPSWCVII